MDYGYVPPDQTYQTLKYHEMILLQSLHGAKKENMRRIAATVPIHNIFERERFTFSDRSSQETVLKLLQTQDGTQCHFCANKII